MGISYDREERIFKLDTPGTTYLLGIVDKENFLGHIYYGRKLKGIQGAKELLRIQESPFTPETNNRERITFMDCFPTEYSSHGVGDYRESSIRVKSGGGHSAVCLTYVSHEIYKGKPALAGLPATFGGEDEVTTLEIVCEDKAIGLQAVLCYSVFEDTDAVARSIRVTNSGKEPLYLEKIMSGCLDMEHKEYDCITLHGAWARERHIQRLPLGHGRHSVSSLRGESGHQEHPFLALAGKHATQEAGEVYGFHFVYSGNFQAMAEVSQHESVRVVMGINPEDFCWKLEPEETFQAPEMILVYSDHGIGGMSRTFHDLYRGHLIRSPYRDKKRPILINNWEATYFDFDTDKLLSIAKDASAMGIEMLVMDDGWFGDRFDDNRALGDWEVNEDKLKGGLGKLVEQINALGMEFGIWFEPEMISPESGLYKEHPDWAIAVPGRTPGRARNQYVLDITRKEVRDCICGKISKVLKSANIKYVKWDMNRPLSDIGSSALPADRQGELYHRYVLGLYEMQERLLCEFPDLLLENCSGGGARFDPGMLYYSPQIWCSDDTDAVERLAIQEGTAIAYPLSTMGAHVSVCPNHAVGRITPFETRGFTALAGTFGYELDVTKLKEEERTMVTRQTAMYHAFNDLVREGDYYRLASFRETHLYDCWQIVSKDRKQSLVFYIQVLGEVSRHSRNIRLQGLGEEMAYSLQDVTMDSDTLLRPSKGIYAGDLLMQGGIQLEQKQGDFLSRLIYLANCEN